MRGEERGAPLGGACGAAPMLASVIAGADGAEAGRERARHRTRRRARRRWRPVAVASGDGRGFWRRSQPPLHRVSSARQPPPPACAAARPSSPSAPSSRPPLASSLRPHGPSSRAAVVPSPVVEALLLHALELGAAGGDGRVLVLLPQRRVGGGVKVGLLVGVGVGVGSGPSSSSFARVAVHAASRMLAERDGLRRLPGAGMLNLGAPPRPQKPPPTATTTGPAAAAATRSMSGPRLRPRGRPTLVLRPRPPSCDASPSIRRVCHCSSWPETSAVLTSCSPEPPPP